MKYVFKLATFFGMTLLVFSYMFTTASAAESDKQKEVAEQILDSYKEKLNPAKYNFENNADFKEAKLGISVPVYQMDITMVANNTGNLSSTMIDTNLIEYAVNFKGNTVTRMTVKKNGDSYNRYGFGGNGKTFAKGLMVLPENARPNVKLVKLGPAEFLYVEINKQERLIYISPAPMEGIENNKIYKTEQIAPKLQLIAKQMIASADSDGGIGQFYNEQGTQNKTNNTQSMLLVIGLLSMLSYFVFRVYKKKQEAK